MQMNQRLPLLALCVWQCPEATRKRPVCLGSTSTIRKHKKCFKKIKKTYFCRETILPSLLLCPWYGQ